MSGTKLLPAAVVFSDQPGLSNRLITAKFQPFCHLHVNGLAPFGPVKPILNAWGSIRFDTIFCDPFSATEFPKVTS
jgi:hypothetical protein